MERFYLNTRFEDSNQVTINDTEIIHKIISVLRLKIGEHIYIFDNDGHEFLARIKEIGRKLIKLEKIDTIHKTTEATPNIILCPALIKKERFEWMLEKCTEIGVCAFRPFISERTVVKTTLVPERWNKIIIEAVQQSGRTEIPNLNTPQSLTKTLQEIKKIGAQIIIAAENSGAQNIKNVFKQIDFTKPIAIFIGPEGGWSSGELTMFKEYQAIIASLGTRILRSETANIVISAFCAYNL